MKVDHVVGFVSSCASVHRDRRSGLPSTGTCSHLVSSCARGAAVDFLGGAKKGAPAWIQRSGLERLYRLLLEPSRLWRRYLVRDLAFVPIALREPWGRRSRRATETSPRDASSDGEPAAESPSA
jgi:hypothetical protein